MSSQNLPGNVPNASNNGAENIFTVNIGQSGQWAQNLVAALLGPLTANLQKIMQEERKAQVEFTSAIGKFEKDAAANTRASGQTEMTEGLLSGGANIIAGGLTMKAGFDEGAESIDFETQGKELASKQDKVDNAERSLETGNATSGTDAEDTLARRRGEGPQTQAEVKHENRKLDDEREALKHKRRASQNKFEGAQRTYQTGAQVVQSFTQAGTKPAKANYDADAGLDKSYSSIAQTGEKVLDGSYSSTEQTVSQAQQAAGNVYGSSRAAAGG